MIAESENPAPKGWIEQACRQVEVPVARQPARHLREVTLTRTGHAALAAALDALPAAAPEKNERGEIVEADLCSSGSVAPTPSSR